MVLTNTENKNVSFKVKRILAGMYGFTIVFMALLKKRPISNWIEWDRYYIVAVTVWKSKQSIDPLGQRLFQKRPNLKCTRSITSKHICLPVPGYPTLSTDIMSRISNTVPGLRDASTIGSDYFLGNGQSKYSDELLSFTCAVCN